MLLDQEFFNAGVFKGTVANYLKQNGVELKEYVRIEVGQARTAQPNPAAEARRADAGPPAVSRKWIVREGRHATVGPNHIGPETSGIHPAPALGGRAFRNGGSRMRHAGVAQTHVSSTPFSPLGVPWRTIVVCGPRAVAFAVLRTSVSKPILPVDVFDGVSAGTVCRMIRFSCKCGFEFNVTDDRAGQTVQCPRCSLLVDVPSIEELAWLAPDGTIAVDASDDQPRVPGQTLAEMYRTFGRHKTDADGNEIDLRMGVDRLARVGDGPDTQGYRPQRIAPRYDPETGERIVPLSLRDETPQPVLSVAERVAEREAIPLAELAEEPAPVEAIPVEPIPVEPVPVEPVPVEPVPVRPVRPAVRVKAISYAVGDAARATTLKTLAVDLIARPGNLAVLVFVSLFYVAGILFAIPLNTFAYYFGMPALLANALNLPLLALLAHYGCVVEDIGPDAIDELPRPLRNFSVGDDLFAPGVRVAAAAVLCFGPAFAVGAVTQMESPLTTAITLSVAAVGCYFFPAVVLTLLTGSTVLNLTPARVMGVIGQCGGQYVASAFLAGAVLFGSAGFVLSPSVLPPLGNVGLIVRMQRHAPLVLTVLGLTIYLTHMFAWHLGLMYRAHHDGFPWLAQRHVRTPRPARKLPVR